MDMCHTAGLISLEQALDKILTQTQTVTHSERIPLTESAQRITAADITSPMNVPHLITLQWMDMVFVSLSGMGKPLCL